MRSAAELFPGSIALVVTVWEPGLGALALMNAGPDAVGAVPVPLDAELVAELDRAGKDQAAVVAGEGAQLARSLGLDAEPHGIPDEGRVADAIVDFASERQAAAVVIGCTASPGCVRTCSGAPRGRCSRAPGVQSWWCVRRRVADVPLERVCG